MNSLGSCGRRSTATPTGLRAALLAILLFAAVCAGVAYARPLPADPRIVSGRLANGVQWIALQHAQPPGKLALMMHVRTGSLNETDEQCGLAHFLEHMVFNGTDNFPPGALIPYFESIGMAFGTDLNASTSFDRTGYSLFLPNVEQAQIDKALTVLSDYAFRATLSDKEIDEERGVILEEARSKKNAGQRIRDKLLPDLFAGMRFAARLPIGDEKIIATAPRSLLASYYRTWYRPELITLIIVGDSAVQPIVPLMDKWFGQYKPDALPKTQPSSDFTPENKPRAIVVSDPELTACTVQMCVTLPNRPPAVTVEQYRVELIEQIGSKILGRRWDEQVKEGKAPYRTAEASVDGLFNQALTVSASANGEGADWDKMLIGLIVELRRACQYGFSERELDLARRDLVAGAERAVRTESTLDGRAVMQSLFETINEQRPIMSAQQKLDLLQETLPAISVTEIGRVFKERFDRSDFAYVVMAPEGAGKTVPTREQVLGAALQAWTAKVEAPAADQGPTQLLATQPVPGRVAESTTDKDFGVTHVWLENGVRVHHRFMDTKKDQVLVSINLAGGGIEETGENLGVSYVAALGITDPATAKLTSGQVRDLKVGHNVKVGGGPVEDDAFALRIAGSPKDLEFGLQLVYMIMTEGRIEPPVFDNFKLATRRRLERNATDVAARASDALGDLLSGGDPRRSMVSVANLERLSCELGQAWLTRLCREAPIEVAVVGDVQWDAARPLVERYLGALPTRSRTAQHLDKLRILHRPPGPLSRRVEVPTVSPAGVAYAGFAGCEGREINDRRALQLAELILTSRLNKRVREELALVYSIDASSVSAWVYRDAGAFRAGSKCKPENADQVVSEVHKLFNDFAEHGPTADDLANAKKQILNRLDISMREPQYWTGLLEQLDLHGRSLDEARTHRQQYEAMTAQTVQSIFRKYYTPERQFSLTVVPTSTASGASASAPASQP